ncbi:uncharacterized protein LOC134259029 isoform X2 [Saccostrea cucullata]
MADRRTQRGSNNKQTASCDSRSADVKRRSRSAGPPGKNKKRNSMDERKFLAAQEKKNKASRYYQRQQELKQGTRHSLYNEPQSDEGGFPNYSSSASDSDCNNKTNWMKSPLNIRNAKQNEKRQPSGTYDNGVYSINENEYNRLESQNMKNRQALRTGAARESDLRDKNGNPKHKFQKLEERRNQRIDFTVTSDDEVNSPEAGITKLRQRALQGSKQSPKLPDTLEDWNFSSKAPQVSSSLEVKRTYHGNVEQVENGSSSSEQITLRQIGPGIRVSKSPNQTSSDGGQRRGSGQEKKVAVQGSYRKIPKQESDFRQIQSANTPEVENTPKQTDAARTGDSINRIRELPSGGYVRYTVEHQGNIPLNVRNVQNRGAENVINFQEVKSSQPVTIKKAMDRMDNKRKSYSDEDSLDDLVESNIQYLESEFENGKLKKLNSQKPAKFPIPVEHRDVNKEKRRSASLDGYARSRPSCSDSFQSEVKLRLQIPSMVQNNRFHQTKIDTQNRGEAPKRHEHKLYSPQVPRKPVQTTANFQSQYPNGALFQNTVPKYERKFQSATASPYLQRRALNLGEMEDISRSETQINSQENGFSYQLPSNFIHPYFKEYQKTERTVYKNKDDDVISSESVIKSVSVPGMESGMFSDVDYDIEVSERIKKWEKYMKKPGLQDNSDKQLGSISETTNDWPMEPETPVPVPQTISVSSTSVTLTKAPSKPVEQGNPQEFKETYFEPKVKSTETNTHRIFRVLQDTKPQQDNPQTMDNTYNWVKNPLLMDTGVGDAQDIESSSTCVEESVLSPYIVSRQGWPPQSAATLIVEKRPSRLSRLEDEINELQDIKIESVRDLRRKFDSDASGNESADVTDTPSTPAVMTPMRQRRHFVRPPQNQESKTLYVQMSNQTENQSTPQSKSYERKINTLRVEKLPVEEDVWSPNMPSDKGMVSIERVKARTLQTIPFSEDPIWKEIEEMTNMELLVNDLNEPAAASPPIRPSVESSVLKRNSYIDFEKVPIPVTNTAKSPTVQQSKPVVKTKPYLTPTIQPLKLTIDTKSSVDALDEVLEDIRSSLQKKPLSPNVQRKRTDETGSSSILSPTVSSTGQIFFPTKSPTKSEVPSAAAAPWANQYGYKPSWQDQYGSSDLNPSMEQSTYVQNQPTYIDPQFTQFPHIINGNYQLDPHLLKEKLLSTGLADYLSETEESRRREPPTPPERKCDAERQVLRSMEELRKLAEDVETRLRQIRSKIVQSDEKKLDLVVSALKKFEPDINLKQDSKSESREEHSRKMEKMGEALSELNRIYKQLDIDEEKTKGSTSLGRSKSFNTNSSRPEFKRTFSDSDYNVNFYRDECLAEVEKETQREFEDINKSFQTLLAEVSSDAIQSPKTQMDDVDHNAQINATLENFLGEFRASNSRSTTETMEPTELKRHFTHSNENSPSVRNTCREILKSEVFTACSGPFNVLVGINGRQRPLPRKKPQSQATVKKEEMSKTDSTTSSLEDGSNWSPVPETKTSSIRVQLSPSLSRESVSKECSDCDEKQTNTSKAQRRFKKNANLTHRKSMPAEMIKKSVETQTADVNWATSVANMREKFSKIDREDSVSSESSVDFKGPKRRRQIARGIAMMLEFFSSSDDERGKMTLSHSQSAPDIRSLFVADCIDKPVSNKAQTPRAVKQRHETKSRKRSVELRRKDKAKEDKNEEASVVSTTSDDGYGTKPPVHPGKQRSFSPEVKNEGDVRRIQGECHGQTQTDESDFQTVQLCKGNDRKRTDDQESERPHSFHELLAMFEPNLSRLAKLKNSLRKCASVEEIQQETIFRKTFSSEPDLSKLNGLSSDRTIFKLEVMLK